MFERDMPDNLNPVGFDYIRRDYGIHDRLDGWREITQESPVFDFRLNLDPCV